MENEIGMFGRVWKTLIALLFIGGVYIDGEFHNIENEHQVLTVLSQDRLPGYDRPDFWILSKNSYKERRWLVGVGVSFLLEYVDSFLAI